MVLVLRRHLRVLGPRRRSRVLGPCRCSRVLGPRCHSRVLGPRRRSRMLGPRRRSRVLGPCRHSRVLGSCCHSRVLVLGPRRVVVRRVRLSFVVVWLVVFGSWWLWLPLRRCCPLSRLRALLTRDGVVSSLSRVVGGAGPPLPFVGGGCWVLVAGRVPALLCGVGVLSWPFVDAGGSDYVGEGGGAHHDQRRTTNRFVVHRLVATSLTAMWHLVCLSEKKKEGG